jgi:hypothetical protein
MIRKALGYLWRGILAAMFQVIARIALRKPIEARLPIEARMRHWVWSAQNYAKGYAWGPVQRWRCCGHTTPGHNPDCLMWGTNRA